MKKILQLHWVSKDNNGVKHTLLSNLLSQQRQQWCEAHSVKEPAESTTRAWITLLSNLLSTMKTHKRIFHYTTDGLRKSSTAEAINNTIVEMQQESSFIGGVSEWPLICLLACSEHCFSNRLIFELTRWCYSLSFVMYYSHTLPGMSHSRWLVTLTLAWGLDSSRTSAWAAVARRPWRARCLSGTGTQWCQGTKGQPLRRISGSWSPQEPCTSGSHTASQPLRRHAGTARTQSRLGKCKGTGIITVCRDTGVTLYVRTQG